MSEGRSFWSSVPGLVTGLAGLLTGIVGLVTVLIQLGVVGGKDKAPPPSPPTTLTTVAGAATPTTVGGGSTSATTAAPATGAFMVPATLDFGAGDTKEKPLTVKNTSAAGAITLQAPTVVGKDSDRFSVSLDTCSRPLAAGLSCTMKVTLLPNGPLRTYAATLQLSATGAARGAEVALTGSTLL